MCPSTRRFAHRFFLLTVLLVALGVNSASGAASKTISLPKLSRNTPQGMEGGFWKVDQNFNPILRLKNVLLNQPLTVTPILYFADGTPFQLPSITLEPAGVSQVNIRIALQSVPTSLQSHLSTYGMAGISYQWSWPAVIATIQNTDEIASLTITNSFHADVRKVHAAPEADSAQVTRGQWWLPTANADGYIALENTSLTSKRASVQFSGHTGNALATQQVSLPSHATTVIRLSNVLGEARGAETAGGVEIHYTGPEFGVLAYSGIEDDSVGYSASPILVEDHLDPDRPTREITVSAPGLMLGNADPAMLFPSGTYFKPYAYFHNVSEKPLQMSLSLVSPDANGTPQTRSLGTLDLQPGESSNFDFESQFTSANPLPNGYGHLTATFRGREGDLMMSAGSVDQSQSYVFEVTPSLQAESASRTICFWSLEGDNDTMMTVWNYKTVPQDLLLTLYYSGGHYDIPIHLAARQSYNLDLMTLIHSRIPDPNGTLIPSNITSGSALLSGPGGELDRISVAASASVFNVRNATCGYVCITCNGATSMSYQTSPVSVKVNGSQGATVELTMATGTVITNPSGGIWSSSNIAIATVNSSGLHSGVSVGQATSSFVLTSVPVNATICGPSGSISCPNTSIGADAPIYVEPVVLTVEPLNLFLGQQGSFLVTGQGFSNAGTVTAVMNGGGIQIEGAQVSGDTVINIPFAVSPGATVGYPYSLSISFSEGDGGLLTLPFPVEVSAPPVSITQLQYTNSLPVWKDSPANPTPTAMSQTVWTTSSTLPSVFVSGSTTNGTISGTATFSVNPPLTSTLSGVRIEGAATGLGLLVATGVTIPAEASSFTANFTGNTPFPAGQTFHNPALAVTWSASYTGGACASSTCFTVGKTASEVYATLANPFYCSSTVPSPCESVNPMPLTAVKLAIGPSGGANATTALQTTWNQFVGPANATGWDGRTLYYYEQGVGFGDCAWSSQQILTQSNGSGQCGAWAYLLQDALAVNGIPSSFETVTPLPSLGGNESWMVVNNWSFSSSPTFPNNSPWIYNLQLGLENGGCCGMVPLPSGSVFGDLTSVTGLPGQNSATPSEKAFMLHFIVKVPSSTIGGPYFDPSYGVLYASDCDFETKAIAAYATRITTTPSSYYAEKPFGGCSVTILP